MATKLPALAHWVEEVAALTRPDNIHWCDGSQQEYEGLVDLMKASGDLQELNQETHPGCYLHLSDPSDVARVEHLTFVCTEKAEEAG
ncbi:MAG: phosphoenolpyruvate carboxykinase, partial [Pseudomonadota bacterium]